MNYSLDKLKEIKEKEYIAFKKTVRQKKSLLKELKDLELDLIEIYNRFENLDKTISFIEDREKNFKRIF